MDNAVQFDYVKIIDNQQKGGFMDCESIDLYAYLFAEKNYLAKTANQLREREIAQQYEINAKKLKQSIYERFYNEKHGWFFDYNLKAQSHLEIFVSEGWIPLWANLATPEQATKIKATMIAMSVWQVSMNDLDFVVGKKDQNLLQV